VETTVTATRLVVNLEPGLVSKIEAALATVVAVGSVAVLVAGEVVALIFSAHVVGAPPAPFSESIEVLSKFAGAVLLLVVVGLASTIVSAGRAGLATFVI
jgi:hypothetical protein